MSESAFRHPDFGQVIVETVHSLPPKSHIPTEMPTQSLNPRYYLHERCCTAERVIIDRRLPKFHYHKPLQ